MASTPGDTAPQVTVTGWRQKRAWDAGALPPVERARPGVWSVALPMPNPLRYVTVYLLETRRGAVLIDAGWPSDEAWNALADGLAATGHSVSDIQAVLITHAHSDHLGLAGRVREISDAWIGLHEADVATIANHFKRPDMSADNRSWLAQRGASSEQTKDIVGQLDALPDVSRKLVQPDRFIEDASLPLGTGTGLRAVWTPGHSPGHLCFVDEIQNLLFAGDHVLPRVSPNIALNPRGRGNPLRSFLESLQRVESYDSAEVLPAHEYRFRGLALRGRDLARHHDTRLKEIARQVERAPGASTWEVARGLTWSRGWEQLNGLTHRSAISETYAHLVYLESAATVVNRGQAMDSWWPNANPSARQAP
jgi:glyoxylase-like metal-dependent hydrolase (beta-lactamase superfamily II)